VNRARPRGRQFSSADFAAVGQALRADTPGAEQLVHRDVLGTGAAQDAGLSDERRHLVRTVNLPSRALSVTLGGLEPGQSTRRHRHSYETIVYVVSGRGRSTIEDRVVQWQAGDAFYVPPWSWHSHTNTSATERALYVACENAPLLQNLGAALREEQQ
jgi:quercetin dioxygenase-like cupin family protein